MVVRIKNLSEGQADCFLIIIENNSRQISILLDGNRESISNSQNLEKEISSLNALDYIIVTHIDNDHIGGILKLLETGGCKEKLAETKIIYNFVTQRNISFKQADRFEKIIKGRRVIKSYTNNYESDDFLFFLTKEDRKICNDIESSKKAFITFLSPTMENANKVWENFACGQDEKAELINENSIVFMLEAGGKRAIFAGDANWNLIEENIKEIFDGKRYTVDLIKIPHHGADHNNIGLENFVKSHKCNKLIITGKEIWDNEHPNIELIKELRDIGESSLEIYSKINLIPYFNTKDGELVL